MPKSKLSSKFKSTHRKLKSRSFAFDHPLLYIIFGIIQILHIIWKTDFLSYRFWLISLPFFNSNSSTWSSFFLWVQVDYPEMVINLSNILRGLVYSTIGNHAEHLLERLEAEIHLESVHLYFVQRRRREESRTRCAWHQNS